MSCNSCCLEVFDISEMKRNYPKCQIILHSLLITVHQMSEKQPSASLLLETRISFLIVLVFLFCGILLYSYAASALFVSLYTVGRSAIRKVLKTKIWGVPPACMGSR